MSALLYSHVIGSNIVLCTQKNVRTVYMTSVILWALISMTVLFPGQQYLYPHNMIKMHKNTPNSCEYAIIRRLT